MRVSRCRKPRNGNQCGRPTFSGARLSRHRLKDFDGGPGSPRARFTRQRRATVEAVPASGRESALMGSSAGDASRTAAMTGVPRRHCRAHSGPRRCPSMPSSIEGRERNTHFAGPKRKPKNAHLWLGGVSVGRDATLDDQVKNSSFAHRRPNQIAVAPSDYVQCGLHIPIDLLPPRHEPILSGWIVSRRFPGV
jgi:hypothetical protein